MNDAMMDVISRFQFGIDDKNGILAPKLEELIIGGICELRGCFFLANLLPSEFDIDIARKQSFDQTQLECDINHIHIEDYLDSQLFSEKTLLEQSFLYGRKLRDLFDDGEKYLIIISLSNDQFLDCNVRFHKKRPGEEWLGNDINLYEECIAIIE